MPRHCSSSPGGATPSQSRRALYRLLDRASLALGLPASVYRTAQVLIRFIPTDAPAPISPARVQELAETLALDPRTIRAHIRRLGAYGLVADQTLAGGHRVIRRRASRIVALHGIDFSPMLARGTELEAEAARIEIEQDERIRLRARISALRRRFRLLAHMASSEIAGKFGELPRRYAHLPLAELARIEDRLIAALAPIDGEAESAPPCEHRHPKTSDRSEESSRPNSPGDLKESVLPLGAVLTTLPPAWRSEFERGGQRNWSGLIATAYARSVAAGIPEEIWVTAVAHLGCRQAALLALAAEAKHIRCPAAWMRALAMRGDEAPLDLSRNLQQLSLRRLAHA